MQPRLNRAELAEEGLHPRVEKGPDDQDVDLHPVQNVQRLERIVGAHDTMAGVAQRLIDQLLNGCVFFEHEDGRVTGWHAVHVDQTLNARIDPDGSAPFSPIQPTG